MPWSRSSMGSQPHNRSSAEDAVTCTEAGGVVVRATPLAHTPAGHFWFLSPMRSNVVIWKGMERGEIGMSKLQGADKQRNYLLEENNFQCLLCPCSIVLAYGCFLVWSDFSAWTLGCGSYYFGSMVSFGSGFWLQSLNLSMCISSVTIT